MSTSCPYCKVPPQVVLWESDYALALSRSSSSEAHAVIIPRRHIQSYTDATADETLAFGHALNALRARQGADVATNGFTVSFDTEVERNTETHLCITVVPRASMVPTLTTGHDNPLGPALLEDLERAVHVDIAVAFIFTAALNAGVLTRLRDVLARETGRVRILTGDYHDVTEPSALRRLLTLCEQAQASGELRGSLELRVFQTAISGSSFHPKAYMFYGDATGTTLATYVGSSNLSKTGLFDGVEWNMRLTSTEAADLARAGFEGLLRHNATCQVTHEWLDAYEKRRSVSRKATVELDIAAGEDQPVPIPTPTSIQAEALAALKGTREAGNRAGLVTLATGLGKTWLSAFDSTPDRGFQRVLFVAHRTEILAQALATFAQVQPTASPGYYTGEKKEFDCSLLFASVQTLSQPEHLARFAPDHFDYIVVDEFHHAAAETYRRVLDHFNPRFLLGLTATPERTDGGDLLALCDENHVFDCGLATGIHKGLLAPFHYFGVPDLVEYEQIPWRGRGFDEEALTTAVATNTRAQNALEQLDSLGGSRVIAFCVSQKHADFMRDYFKEHTTRRCASVHSGPCSDPRSRTLEQLAAGELDVLFCVDMFNEGLDVPSIDTVLMLRPTESKVIWLQQLGRGLRKHAGKTHLRVIDYIGNHRSFLEKPAALLAALGVNVASPQQLTRLLNEQNFELPPGCEVTYTLEAREILERLCPPSRRVETLREWYVAFRAQAERRPSAREALHSGYKPASAHQEYGTWLEFVRVMGDLTDAEQQALEEDREFLHLLETLPAQKSDEIVLVDALRTLGNLPGEVSLGELSTAYKRRASRSALLTADIPVDLGDEIALTEFLRERPIAAWCARPDSAGRAFFTLQGNMLRSDGIRGGTESFQALTAELIEWRIAEFLSRKSLWHGKRARPSKVLDHTGAEVDARFQCEDFEGDPTVVFDSRGAGKTPRNSEYARGLELLLERLGRHNVRITRIAVISGPTRVLPLERRILKPEGFPYPIDVSSVPSVKELRVRIGRAGAAVRLDNSAKGSGNSTKRLRIWLSHRVDQETLAGRKAP